MSDGSFRSNLWKFKLPAELEVGMCYEYRVRFSQWIFMLPTVFVLEVAFRVYQAATGLSVTTNNLNFLVLLMAVVIYLPVELSKRKRVKNFNMTVEEERLVVKTGQVSAEYAFTRIGGGYVPSLSPTIFESSERFGSSERSIVIDRRFLVKCL